MAATSTRSNSVGHSGAYNSFRSTSHRCDGSVHFIKSSINGLTWRALGSIAGGEIISSDQY
jgi:hypothetical protein